MAGASDREECHGVRQTLRRPRVLGGVASVAVGNGAGYVWKRLPGSQRRTIILCSRSGKIMECA